MADKNTKGEKKEKENTSQDQKGQNSSSKKNVAGDKQQKKNNVLDMNLAEGEIIYYFSWKRAAFILVSAIVMVVLVLVAASWSISWWGEERVEQNEIFTKKTQQIEGQMEEAKSEAEDLFIFKKKLELANKLMDEHIYWTSFFNYLEKNTLKDVYYTDFKGGVNGVYSMPVKTNDYSVINSQVKRLRKDENTKRVKVREASQGGQESETEEVVGERIELNMDLEVDKQIFTE